MNELQSFRSLVTVDLLDIELAHEVDRFLCQYLAGHHDREAGRIGNDEIRRNQQWALLQSAIDFLIVQPDVLAARSTVRGIEAATNVAFGRADTGIASEGVM